MEWILSMWQPLVQWPFISYANDISIHVFIYF